MRTTFRPLALLLIVCLAAAVGTTGSEPQQAPGRAGRIWAVDSGDLPEVLPDSPANRAVRMKLLKPYRKFEFGGVPLEQVIEFMRELMPSNIHVKWAALEQAGINRDTPVNVKLYDVPAAKALQVILEDVGGVNPLEYVVEDGVIVISTHDDLSRRTVVRVYDVRDLLAGQPAGRVDRAVLGELVRNAVHRPVRLPQAKPSDQERLDSLAEAYRGRIDALAGAIHEALRNRQAEELTDVIRMVAPDSWQEAGGRASIRHIAGQLVISQTQRAHEQITRLLMVLRGDLPPLPTGPPAPTPETPAEGEKPADVQGGTSLDDIQVDFLIDVSQAGQNARMLTAPRVRVYNGGRAYVTLPAQKGKPGQSAPGK